MYTAPLKNFSATLRNFFIPRERNQFRPGSLERSSFLAYILIALVLKLGLMSFLTALPGTLFFADVTRSALIALTNDARVAQGLAPLRENALLQKAAEDKARDILAKGYFAHESPDGKTPWYWFLRAGYRYLYAGENLAIDFLDSPDIARAWLASSSHRANIENPNYRDIGIGVVAGRFGSATDASSERIVVVQLFGQPQRLPAAPKAISPTIPESPSPSPSIPTPPLTPSPTGMTAAPQESPTDIVAATGDKDTSVLGVSEPVVQQPADSMPLRAKFMLWSEQFLENVFFAFLAFIILASALNLFIRPDVQYADLIARSLILVAFFVVLVALREASFLHLAPQVLPFP